MAKKNGGWAVASDIPPGWSVAPDEPDLNAPEIDGTQRRTFADGVRDGVKQGSEKYADIIAALLPRTTSETPGGFVPKFAGDVLSIPGRAIATLAAPGETVEESMSRTGGREGEPAWMQTLDRILRDPVNAVLPGAGRVGGALGRVVPGAGKIAAAGRAAVQMAPVSAAIGAGGQMDRFAHGEPVSAREALADAAITEATGLGAMGVGAVAPRVIRSAADALQSATGRATPALRWGAGRLVTKVGKPQISPTKADIIERGEDWLVRQGNLPLVVKNWDFGAPGIYENFAALKKAAGVAVGAEAQKAKEAGARINMDRAVEDATRYLKARMKSGEGVVASDPEASRAVDWMKARVLNRTDIPEVEAAIADAKIPYRGSLVPLKGQREIADAVPEVVGTDAAGMPVMGTRTSVRYEPTVEGYQRLPDYYQPIPDVEVSPVRSENVKRAFQRLAYAPDKSEVIPAAVKQALAKGLEQGIRKQTAEVAPGLAAANRTASPIYNVEDYFSYFPKRATNNILQPVATAVRAGQTQLARRLWDLSTALDAIPGLARDVAESDVAGDVRKMFPMTAVATDNARGGRR